MTTRPLTSFYHALRKRAHWLRTRRRYISLLVADELHKPAGISLSKRLWSWRRGFLSQSYRIYGLDRNDPSAYLSDAQRTLEMPFINAPYSVVLDNKLIFRDVMARFPGLVPRHLALLQGARIRPLQSDPRIMDFETLLDWARAQGAAVIKPTHLGGGQGVKILQPAADGWLLNNRRLDTARLPRALHYRGPQVLTEYVQQAAYARQIYPHSANSLRILTLWDGEIGAPFIAIAVQRLGTPASHPVDNVAQGGLSAQIDLETGVLGPAAVFLPDGHVRWARAHPHSHAQIEGVRIPNWSALVSDLLAVAGEFPHIPNIGWDIIVTDDGFRVIEGNNFTSLQLLQVHRGLLADPRVRAFYRRTGVI